MGDANPFVLALTGERLAVDVPLEELPRVLAEAGWDEAALVRLRQERQRDALPWPFEVPGELLARVGFAQFAAGLAQLRAVLGVDGLVPAQPVSRPLNADERRLSADRPPHWG